MTNQHSKFPMAFQTSADLGQLESSRHMYLKPREAWTLLRISKSTFYRLYYPMLSQHPTTVRRNGHFLYRRDAVLALLRPVGTASTAGSGGMRQVRRSQQAARSQLQFQFEETRRDD